MIQSKQHDFHIDASRLIEVLAKALYKDLATPIRDLLQDAFDSCIIRKHQEDYQPRIFVSADPATRTVVIQDNGMGMSEENLSSLFSTLGTSLTTDLSSRVSDTGHLRDQVGHYGLGLLSALSIADTVGITTCATNAKYALRATLTATFYTIDRLDVTEAGTKYTLRMKTSLDDPLRVDWLRKVTARYGKFLPVPFFVGDDPSPVNPADAPWLSGESVENYLQYVHARLDASALAAIPIRIRDDVQADGVLYIPSSNEPADFGVDLYVRGMFVQSQHTTTLPDWARFVRGIVNARSLCLSISRETVIVDEALLQTRALLEKSIVYYFKTLAIDDPRRLNALVSSKSNALKRAVLESDKLFDVLIDWIKVDTTHGAKTLPQTLSDTTHPGILYYISSRRDELQYRAFFSHHKWLVIDAGDDDDYVC